MGDGTRRAILARLLEGPATVSQLGKPARMTLAAVLKHIRALEAARLVETSKAGRVRTVQLRPDAFVAVLGFLDAYRFAALPRFDAAAGYIDLSDMDVT